MGNKSVLDTHALIWYLEGNPKMGPAARTVMDDPTSEMVLPTIVLTEAIHIVSRGRTAIPAVADLFRDVLKDSRIELAPLTLGILQQSLVASTVPEMHDRLIVATALHLESLGHQVEILTKDRSMIAVALVDTIW